MKKKDIIKHNELVKHNRELVERLVDVVIYLANQELPFRGHAEDKNSEIGETMWNWFRYWVNMMTYWYIIYKQPQCSRAYLIIFKMI